MPYGTIKVDTVTFTNAGVDKSVTLSGLVQNPVFSGNVTVTGTLSGVTVTGTTANFTSGNFTNISGGTHTITSGVFAAGSAASPSITFTGDLNTGIYSPGADQVAISTGGSGRLFVDASGNVGVGAAPSTRFETYVASGGNTLRLTNASNTGSDSCSLQFVQGGAQRAVLYTASNILYLAGDATTVLSAGTTSPLVFNAGSSERLRITSAGLVGVGTSSPGAGVHISTAGQTTAALDTAGSLNTIISDTGFAAGNGGSLVFGASGGVYRFAAIKGLLSDGSNNSQGSLAFSTRNASTDSTLTERLRITPDGKVGIGTTSPTQPLQVAGNARIGLTTSGTQYSTLSVIGDAAIMQASPLLNFTSADGAARFAYINHGGTGGELFILNQEAGPFRLGTGNLERARIDSSGRLLVGTSTSIPTFGVSPQFEVAGGEAYQANLAYRADAFAPYISIGHSRSASVGTHTILQNGDDFGTLGFVGSDGSSFVRGATISAQVDGTPGANDMPGRIVLSTTADGASSPTERMRITSAGNVGIGVTSPQAAIHAISFTGLGIQTYSTLTGGAPATSGTTDPNVVARFQGGSVLFDIGGTTAGLQWIQPRLSSNFAANFGLAICPNGGNVGIGTTTPGAALNIGADGDFWLASSVNTVEEKNLISWRIEDGSEGARISAFREAVSNAPHSIAFFTRTSGGLTNEKARIDSSGRLLVGVSSYSGAGTGFEIEGTGSFGPQIRATAKGSDQFPVYQVFRKSRGASIVQNGDFIFEIKGEGFDGSTFVSSATIRAEIDGTPGTNDMPGRLVFSTTADGASVPTERMRISQNGSHTLTGGPGSSHTILTNNAERIRWNDNGSYITTLPTTGSGANVHIWTGSAPANLLMLSTSSQRYKTDIEDLDADRSNAVLNFRPVWYRSTCELDRKDWSWYGLIAEEVAEIEPRLVHWTYLDDAYEVSRKEDGTTEKTLKEDAKLVPNGVQYDRLTVLLLDLAQRQEERIAALEAKVAALETP